MTKVFIGGTFFVALGYGIILLFGVNPVLGLAALFVVSGMLFG